MIGPNTEIVGPFDPKKISLPPRLDSDRLNMVPVVVEDFDYHWEVRSNATVMEHFPTVADDRAALEADFLDQFHNQKYYKFFYAVSLKDEAGIDPSNNRTNTIAMVLLRPYLKGTEMELGYMASPRVWGRGVVPEACTRVLDHGFNDMNLAYVVALISPGNEKSERVIEKLGFTFGEVVTDDERTPELNKFILLKEDWKKVKA